MAEACPYSGHKAGLFTYVDRLQSCCRALHFLAPCGLDYITCHMGSFLYILGKYNMPNDPAWDQARQCPRINKLYKELYK